MAMEDLFALKSALELAVSVEDFQQAAILRDQIRQFELADPLVSLRTELDSAIAEERYGDAALLRDQIKELEPPPPPPLTTTSSKVTEGVRVSVESAFVSQQSQPEASAYLFAYKITITNESHPTTIKLVSRHWFITDAEGRQQEVQGPGVVGEQPELAPGESYTYQSACPLRTPTGNMKGTYEMYSRPSESGPWTTSFLVEVAEFGLDTRGPSGQSGGI